MAVSVLLEVSFNGVDFISRANAALLFCMSTSSFLRPCNIRLVNMKLLLIKRFPDGLCSLIDLVCGNPLACNLGRYFCLPETNRHFFEETVCRSRKMAFADFEVPGFLHGAHTKRGAEQFVCEYVHPRVVPCPTLSPEEYTPL